MISVITSISRLTLVVFVSIFAISDVILLIPGLNKIVKTIFSTFAYLMVIAFLANGTLVLYVNTADIRLLVLFICQFLFFSLSSYLLQTIINPISNILLINVNMLLSFSFITLERLDMDRAIRQFVYVVIALLAAIIILLILKNFKYTRDIYYVYFAVGAILLLLVLLLGIKEYGAKLSLDLKFFSVQPSEFVKLIFAFFISSCVVKLKRIKGFLASTVGSVIFVLILAKSNDFGTACIFMITYMLMIFIASGNYLILLGEVFAGVAGGMTIVKLFPHIQTRFIAWRDPLSVVDDQGYQISQSLFAIGTGGWMGSGLYQGSPNKIPVVAKDFIFSAISEELGGIIALELIVILLCTILFIFIAAIETRDRFFMLVSTGVGIYFAAQTFLNVGGVTNFIPSTGVTLPFVSYGGSSMLALFIAIAVVEAGDELGFIAAKRKKAGGK